jgi:hypothetical protein
MDDPRREDVAEEFLAMAEELVEEHLNRRQARDVLALHHFPSGHAPAPVDVVGVGLQDGPDGEAAVVEELGEDKSGVAAPGDDGGGDDVGGGVAEGI